MLATITTYTKQNVPLFAPLAKTKLVVSELRCASCNGDGAHYYCQYHVRGNHYCGKQLCRGCTYFGTPGMDYCNEHLPVSEIGAITVGNIYHYKDFNAGEYIGRKALKEWGYHPGSPLANPAYINIKTATEAQKEKNLADFHAHLQKQYALKGETWRALLRLRDLVLAGKDVLLLCYCKDRQGQGRCHGDIVKAAIEKMVEKVMQRVQNKMNGNL